MRLIPVKLAGMIEHLTAANNLQRFEKTSETWRSVDCPKEVAAATWNARGVGICRTWPDDQCADAPPRRIDP